MEAGGTRPFSRSLNLHPYFATTPFAEGVVIAKDEVRATPGVCLCESRFVCDYCANQLGMSECVNVVVCVYVHTRALLAVPMCELVCWLCLTICG